MYGSSYGFGLIRLFKHRYCVKAYFHLAANAWWGPRRTWQRDIEDFLANVNACRNYVDGPHVS